MKQMLSMEGPVMRALSELMTLLKLNVLTILCSIPIITAGAAYTSMHFCIMKMLDGEDAHIAGTFFKEFKSNLKSVTPSWLIFLFGVLFLYFDTKIFPAQGDGKLTPMLILVYFMAIILCALFVWFFPMAARFENSTAAKFKNAALMAVGSLPRTIVMMFVTVSIPFVLFNSSRLLPLAFLFGLSLPAYFCAILYYPVIKKQIKLILGETDEEE